MHICENVCAHAHTEERSDAITAHNSLRSITLSSSSDMQCEFYVTGTEFKCNTFIHKHINT